MVTSRPGFQVVLGLHDAPTSWYLYHHITCSMTLGVVTVQAAGCDRLSSCWKGLLGTRNSIFSVSTRELSPGQRRERPAHYHSATAPLTNRQQRTSGGEAEAQSPTLIRTLHSWCRCSTRGQPWNRCSSLVVECMGAQIYQFSVFRAG